MFDFPQDVVNRALLVEDKNSAKEVFEVALTEADGSTRTIFARILRGSKDPQGKWESFEIGRVYSCLVNGQEAFFHEVGEYEEGMFLTRNSRGAFKTRRGSSLKCEAKLFKSEAQIFTVYVDKAPNLTVALRREPEYAKASFTKQDKIVELMRESIYGEFINDKSINRIAEQKSDDERMMNAFPEWIAEYDPVI